MVSREPQHSLKSFGEFAEERIKFAQCAWPVLIAFAALWTLFSGASPAFVLVAFFVSILPFLAWLLVDVDGGQIGQAGANLLAITWTLVSFAGIAASGGALSPLSVMLVLGPLTLIGLGYRREAIEAAVLGSIAYGAAVLAGLAGWTDVSPDSWRIAALPWTVMSLVQLVLLSWSFAASDPVGARARAKETPLVDHNLPLLLVDVTEQGRIRGVYGSRDLGWPNLQPGKLIETVGLELGAKTVTNFAGDAFRVVRRVQRGGGEWIGLVLASEIKEPDAVAIADLKDRAMAAEAGLKERTAFFAGLGHDLKTPLNAILGFADLMKAEVRGPMPEAYKDYPTIIHESGQDLMLLVEDILDLAKADANSHRLELEPVDLVASAASVIRQLEDQAARASVKLALTGDAEVWAEADPRAVRQIWQNLLSNAIKYSNEGDTVTLTAGSLASSVFLSVKDHGAGMDQEDLDRIARPFAQGANAKGRAGTGLGLAVVQRFAELHGGRVVIDTAPGKGTRIRLTLPAASSDAVSPFGNAAQ